MIRALHAISTLLLLIAIGFLVYNLMWQFAANGQIKFLSIEELGNKISEHGFQVVKTFANSYIPPNVWAMFAAAPAATVFAAIALVLYLPLRILMMLGVGKKPKSLRR